MLIILVIIVASALGGWYFFSAPSRDASEKTFVITKGEGIKDIGQHLLDQGFIKNKLIFEVYVVFKHDQVKFQAGEHVLKKNMSLGEVVSNLISAAALGERDIKILEGWNDNEIANYLDAEGVVPKEVFLGEIKKYAVTSDDYDFLKDGPAGATLEGYLFPDTYRVYKEMPLEFLGGEDKDTAMADLIIKKMLDNFDQKLTPDLRAEIARQKKTIFEIITMASLIEKEARGDDMAMVSDIFWRRIDAGIPLQSDASLNYATGKYETQPSSADLTIDSPYNTYKYRGLPVGPIGNPSLEAIRAAIYPKANSYWYFLTTDDGQMIYSKTFDEHKVNKAKYLQ